MWHPFKKKSDKEKEKHKQEAVVERLIHRDVKKYTDYLSSPWRIMWTNFLAGVAHGLGIVLGATLVLTLVTFVLSKFLSHLPFVGEFFEAMNVWIEHTLSKKTL